MESHENGRRVMGIERLHTPRYWRKRAEEFRTKADGAEQGEVKASLIKIAQHYDDLAHRAEKIRTVQDLVGSCSLTKA